MQRVGEDALRNILSAYASHNPTVGYCQGMNFLAATLLLEIKDEEKSFWVLSVLVERILVQYYHNSLVGLRIDQVHPCPRAQSPRHRLHE